MVIRHEHKWESCICNDPCNHSDHCIATEGCEVLRDNWEEPTYLPYFIDKKGVRHDNPTKCKWISENCDNQSRGGATGFCYYHYREWVIGGTKQK